MRSRHLNINKNVIQIRNFILSNLVKGYFQYFKLLFNYLKINFTLLNVMTQPVCSFNLKEV